MVTSCVVHFLSFLFDRVMHTLVRVYVGTASSDQVLLC